MVEACRNKQPISMNCPRETLMKSNNSSLPRNSAPSHAPLLPLPELPMRVCSPT